MTLWGWIISHRCSWMAVYVLCCNTQTNLIVVFMSCICIVMLSLFVNCPYIIRSPNMLFIFHGEDTTSELWTPVHSCTLITIYCKLCSLYLLQTNPIFHTIRLTLCFSKTGEIDNLTVPLGQSTLVVCVQVPRCFDTGGGACQHQLLQPQKWFLSPTGSIILGFILSETYLLCSTRLKLGVSQRVRWGNHGPNAECFF